MSLTILTYFFAKVNSEREKAKKKHEREKTENKQSLNFALLVR